MQSKTSPRTARRALSVALVAALAGFSGLAAAQTINAPGLRAPGSITYDAEGVPVVQAQNDLDAAFLLGYAHARDRFFQMDFNRRGASGTVSELVGPAGLANDVQIRTLGLRRAAFATWQAMSAETKGWLKAYADGVNLWLRSTPSLPPEYAALELTRAEPWSPVDSIVIGKALAFQLSFDLDTDLTQRLVAYQTAGQQAGFNGTALFFEDTHRVQPPDDRVSIPGFAPSAKIRELPGAKTLGEAVAPLDPAVGELAAAYTAKVKDHPLIGPALRRREDRGASNWWIVSGAETQSGKPILANDPHLGLDLPPVFQEVHVISAESGMNVVGSSVPGTPAVLLGCTERFCWGLTTNPMDVTDTYQETFIVNSYGLPTHTIYQGRAEPVNFVLQLFNVNTFDGVANNLVRDNSIGYLNGAATILVPRRNNGPVVQISGNRGLSVQYAGWGATFELEAFRQINLADSLDDFRAAVSRFDVGSQNFAYADVDGNIAYFVSAEMPVRDDLENLRQPDGGVPPFIVRDGSGQRRHEWLPAVNRYPGQALPYEILSPSEMPFTINPAQGYIANANNDPVGTTLDNNPLNQLRPTGGLYYLNVGYSAYRMGRIDRVLKETVDSPRLFLELDMRRLQANNQLLDAELVFPYLSAASGRALTSDWADLQNLGASVRDAILLMRNWASVPCGDQPVFSTPTGIPQGFDPGDTFPPGLPSECEVERSVGATLYSVWRSQVTRNVIDAKLTQVGLGNFLPDSDLAFGAVKYLLDTFDQRGGVGASGINFFQVPGAPTAADARDFLLLKSLRDALDLLASDAFKPAFNNSTNLMDYRWGRLHRITFDHPLGGPLSVPGEGLFGFQNLSPELPGIPRAGGFEVVDASGHSARANSVNGFMFGGGPARRFVGEMTTPPVAQQILPGGQSGVPLSAAYVSQLPRWLINAYKPLNITVAAATANPAATVNFTPGQ